MLDIVEISKKVLERLTSMGYEKEGIVSTGQLIFPSKSDGRRISEQELRQLFIEEFKKKHTDLYFSIETPTIYSYSFTNDLKEIKVGDDLNKGQSALIDMCILKKESKTSHYTRLLNIEFKHKNATEFNISKDILKLMHEEENGAFVLLLKNTDNGTLKSVFKKFSNSFASHLLKDGWSKNDKTFIEIIILSLEERDNKENGTPFSVSRKIEKGNDLSAIFSFDGSLAIIEQLKKNGWEIEKIEKICVGDVEENNAKYGER